jgi:flagellar basal-body rod protein FlgB
MTSRIDEAFGFQQAALRLREARQSLLASNIANADTPNFKARDIDFASALQGALSGQSGQLPLTTTALKHFSGGTGENIMGAPVLYRSTIQPSADGNSVDMDVERAQFADNAVRYEASVKFVSDEIKDVMSAIQG